MLDKLNKIKWSQLPTMTINTHNELSYNNSEFENLQKNIVKFQFFFLSITRYIQVLFLLIFFYIIFLITSLNKISRTAHCIEDRLSNGRLSQSSNTNYRKDRNILLNIGIQQRFKNGFLIILLPITSSARTTE